MSVRALNLYYARDDSARAQVIETRLRATDVRESIGIARGRVFTRVNGEGDLPDVLWDCPFADARAHDADMRTRAASVEFEACRAAMRTLTRRFERVIYDALDDFGAPDIGHGKHMLQIWLISRTTPDVPILRSLGATTVLHRADGNATLPDWIVEMPASEDGNRSAIETWMARQPRMQATRVRWQRTG